MRSPLSVKALANNINDAGVRDALSRLDDGLQDVYSAVTRLQSNKKPDTRAQIIVVPGTSGGGLNDGDYGDVSADNDPITGLELTVEGYGGVEILPLGTNLQTVIDNAGTGRAKRYQLLQGTYYGNSSSPSTPLTVPNTIGTIEFFGLGQDLTIIKSPILCETAHFGLKDLAIKPTGTAYGLKIFKSGEFTSRCWTDHVWIGASFYNAGDGPIVGMQLDGAGVFLAHKTTLAFNTSHGLLIDSTAAEPNTTLKFDMCSFVGNEGWGTYITGSCTIAEFNGGNMEQNDLGELYAENMNHLRCHSVDFESNKVIANQIEIQNCNPVEITSCNFVTAASSATRAGLMSGSEGIIFTGNRFAGWGAVGVFRIGETCTNVYVGPNNINRDVGNGWIENYSRP